MTASLLLCLIHSRTDAQDRSLAELDYAAPETSGCPDEQAFRDIVAARLGYDPFRFEAPMAIHASIVRSPHGLTGNVRATDAASTVLGDRQIEGSRNDCGEVATSMAIAISVLLDPFGIAGATQPAASAPQPVTTPPAGFPAAPPPPIVDSSSTDEPGGSDIHLVLHGGAAVSVGLTPGWTLGPRFGIGIMAGGFVLLADAMVDLMPAQERVESGDVLEATVFTAGPTACLSIEVFMVCIGAQLGAFQGQGTEVRDPQTQTSFFASADARAGVEVPINDVLAARAMAEVRVPIVRTSLEISGVTVWNAPSLGGGLSLGLAASF